MTKQLTISRQQFKKFIVFQFALTVLSVVAIFATEPSLPQELQTYLSADYQSPLTVQDWIMSPVILIIGIWGLQNIFALYQFRSYAPRHYVWLTLAMTAIYLVPPFSDPVVMSGIASGIWDLCMLSTGFTVAVIYFSSLADEFGKNISTTDTDSVIEAESGIVKASEAS